MSDVIISVDNLKAFMKESLLKAGVPNDDADIVVDVLISSDLRGIESHGIGRLQMYLNFIKDGVQTPVTKYEILKETPGTALIDAKFGMGHVVSYHAMKLAIEKAKKTGIAAVSVRNSTHFGICGYYPLMAIKENMAGFAVTNARPSIAPTFSNDPMFGTNPIAFGVPTDEPCPFLLDMATSITQRGKVEVYDRIGKTMPEGWAMDRDGNYVTDPTKLLGMFASKAASLLPLGGAGEDLSGYKGYGLAMMVEILSSAFSGGPFCWGLSGLMKTVKKCQTNWDIFSWLLTFPVLSTLMNSKQLPEIWPAKCENAPNFRELNVFIQPAKKSMTKNRKYRKKVSKLMIPCKKP